MAATDELPPPYSEDIKSIHVLPTRFEPVRLPLREHEITAVLPVGGKIWIGTTDGLFLFDGLSSVRPQASGATPPPTLYVKSLLGLSDGSILVGTINGSIWHATADRLDKLLDLKDRDEFEFVRAADGKIYVAESFGRLRQAQLRGLLPGLELRLLPGGFARLAVSKRFTYAATDSGSLFQFDSSRALDDPANKPARLNPGPLTQYPRQLKTDSRGWLWMATDTGIEVIDPSSGASKVVSDGQCGGVGESRFGQIWLACTGRLAEFDGTWRTWLVDGAFGRGSIVMPDDSGNLWVGGDGLWRAYQYARTLVSNNSVRQVALAGPGALWTVSNTGAISQLQLRSLASRPVLPPAPGKVTLTVNAEGQVFALHDRTLWRVDDAAMIAPLPEAAGELYVAMGTSGTFLAERGDLGRVWRLDGGQFAPEPINIRSPSGSGAACIGMDRLGRVWIASASQLFVRLPTGQWLTTPDIPYAPETKLNRWGTFWLDAAGKPVVFGPWGYAVAPEALGNTVVTERVSALGHGQPWLATAVIRNRALGMVLGTDNGLYASHGGTDFSLLGSEDTRLRAPILSLAALDDTSFVAATELGLVQVNLALPAPALEIALVPPVIKQRILQVTARAPGLSGPPERRYSLTLIPAAGQAGPERASADGNFILDNLRDATSYHLTMSVIDALGTQNPTVERSFRVSVPLAEKRWFGPLLAALLLLIIASILFSSRLSAFALRALGRKRWRLSVGVTDLALEVRLNQEEVSFTAVTQSLQVTTRMEERVPIHKLSGLFPATDIDASLEQAIAPGWDQLPANFRFAIQTFPRKHVVLQIDDELIQCLWEVTGPTELARLGATAFVSRVVTTDRAVARERLAASRLSVLIVAPTYTGEAALRAQATELRLVTQRFRRAGANVTLLDGVVSANFLSDALPKCHILHFVGHAAHDPAKPDQSGLKLTVDFMSATDLFAVLKDGGGPSLVFINACSSGAEQPWIDGAQALYGIASPFIRSGAYFVGARWPVREIFAAEFADHFYRALLPLFGIRGWVQWLAGRKIAGDTLGSALSAARLAMDRGPETLPTWSSYVAYGDPTAQLLLR